VWDKTLRPYRENPQIKSSLTGEGEQKKMKRDSESSWGHGMKTQEKKGGAGRVVKKKKKKPPRKKENRMTKKDSMGGEQRQGES